MLTKTIKYVDYDGNERTETFLFHLSKSELAEMEMSVDGGMTRMLTKIAEEKNGRRIMDTFRDLILRSYGEKSADGRRFIKTQELRDSFYQTEAYSQLFMTLVTNADEAAKFVRGLAGPAEAEAANKMTVPNT